MDDGGFRSIGRCLRTLNGCCQLDVAVQVAVGWTLTTCDGIGDENGGRRNCC